jgi:hypothetical protein
MRKTNRPVYPFLPFLCLVLILSACQASQAASTQPPASAQPWQVTIAKFEIKNSLNSTESVTQYNGSKIDVVHTQSPDAGNVYLIMDGTVSKTDNQSSAPFDWQWLVVKDASGKSYQRLANDTFLEQYQYTPRITGLELRFGENSGWMAYEIPTSAAAGKLILAYTAEGNQQEIVLQK